MVNIGVFLNQAELSLNSLNLAISGKLINHRSMNWAPFKDLVSHMCLVGGWMAGSSPFAVITNIFVAEFAEFIETFRKNSKCIISNTLPGLDLSGPPRLQF